MNVGFWQFKTYRPQSLVFEDFLHGLSAHCFFEEALRMTGADPRGGVVGPRPPDGNISHDYLGVAIKNFTSPSDPHNFLL